VKCPVETSPVAQKNAKKAVQFDRRPNVLRLVNVVVSKDSEADYWSAF
jgi:hypothetical protein